MERPAFKWLLVAPGIGPFLALSVYPLLFSLWVNFVNYDFNFPVTLSSA